MLKKELVKSKATAKVTFTLPIEAIIGAKEVRIATINLAAGKTYEFRYKGDNGVWANDWSADNYVPAPYNVDNSVVVVPAKKGKATAKADITAKPKKAAVKKVNCWFIECCRYYYFC